MAATANDVIVVVRHSRGRLVDKVDYITAPGRKVSVIVTSEAILERQSDGFVMTRWLGDVDQDTAVKRVRARTGWAVRVSGDLCREPDPSPQDVALLRSFDPRGQFFRR